MTTDVCHVCGSPVRWVAGFDRPLSTTDQPTYPGADGVVYDRRAGAVRHVQDLPAVPPRFTPFHPCAGRRGAGLGLAQGAFAGVLDTIERRPKAPP